MGSTSGDVAIAVEWSFVMLSLSFILIRIYLRIFYHQTRPNTSDILVISGWIFALGAVSCDTMVYRAGGMDYGTFAGGDEDVVYLLKLAYVGDMFNDVGFYFSKLSLLALYYEIISIAFSRLRIALHVITAYVFGACIITWCFDALWCIPISDNWSLDYSLCHVWLEEKLSNSNWGLNITSDLAIFILPFFLFQHLNLSRQQSLGLVATFLLGAITMLCSTARFIVLHLSILTDFAPIYILYSMEINVSLIVVTIPLLKPLIRRRRKGRNENGSYSYQDTEQITSTQFSEAASVRP